MKILSKIILLIGLVTGAGFIGLIFYTGYVIAVSGISIQPFSGI
jgi:hypothetical protein